MRNSQSRDKGLHHMIKDVMVCFNEVLSIYRAQMTNFRKWGIITDRDIEMEDENEGLSKATGNIQAF